MKCKGRLDTPLLQLGTRRTQRSGDRKNGFGQPLRFLCPECGSHDAVPTRAAQPQPLGKRRGYVCSQCRREIPAHLAERWGDLSIEEARREWREVYRDLPQSESATFPV